MGNETAGSMFAENLRRVRQRIANAAARAARQAEDIDIIAVTKTQSVQAIQAAVVAGLTTLGENRVQEWDSKRSAFEGSGIRCHLIGHLQSNKSRKAAAIFDRIDSVDSLPLAERLDAAAGELEKRLGVLIEVHLSGEESKSGVEIKELDELADGIIGSDNLDLLGLMTIPPLIENVELVRPYFRQLRELRDGLRGPRRPELPVLSMGMSHDFEVAIEEGATEVRLGTALFGARLANA
jgi:pyridoxal phosphate enzyme (YggS family)